MTLENLERGVQIKERIKSLMRQKKEATADYQNPKLTMGYSGTVVLDNKESIKRIMAYILYEINSELQELEKEFESL